MFSYGCKQTKIVDSPVDKKFAELKKYPKDSLTRIDVPLLLDLGEVKQDDIVSSFKIRNIGNYLLKQILIKGDCDCTSLRYENKDLLPNQELKVDFEIDIKNEKGWFTKTIFVYGTFYPYRRVIKVEGKKIK